jgi:translation elongation factor EF-1alpha
MATFFVQKIFRIFGGKGVIVGQVRSDVLRLGMTTTIQGKTMAVKEIVMAHKQVSEAKTGDNAGIMLENAELGLIGEGTTLEFQ